MSRRYTSDGYNEPRDSDRRGSRYPRDVEEPRAVRDGQEQPIIRDLRERRYPGERRDYADPRDYQERAEVRIARGSREPRDSRDPRYGRETRDNRDEMDIEKMRPPDRIYLQNTRDPKQAAESAGVRDILQDRIDTRDTRYVQEPRRMRDERGDPGLLSRAREYEKERHVQEERGYPRGDQQNLRNDLVDQGPMRLDNPRDSTLPPTDARVREYFLPGEGISREVIRVDLGLYLGPDTTCRPGVNREGVLGYFIGASRPLTRDMISNMMASSRSLEDEARQRRDPLRRTDQSSRSDLIEEPEDLAPIPGRLFPARARDSEGYSSRRQSNVEYPQRALFDLPEIPQVDIRSDREMRYNLTDQMLVHGSSGHGGSSFSQGSTYDSPWSGSRTTQRSSRSSYSTAPSSVQSISDERRGVVDQDMDQHQSSSSATQSYIDPRTHQRVTMIARPEDAESHEDRDKREDRHRPRRSLTRRHDAPPGWDDTPNFRRL